MASANDEIMLIAQIETAQGVENCEAIAAVEGIDCLWIGHFDLTASMGIPAQFDHPEFLAAVDRVLAACAKHGKAAGIMAGNVESAEAVAGPRLPRDRLLGRSLDLPGRRWPQGIAALRQRTGVAAGT